MKSYVEAVGISPESLNPQKKKKEIEKKKSTEKVNPISNTASPNIANENQSNAIINQLSIQINQLKEIIRGMCHVLVQDDREKSKILQQMNAIGETGIEHSRTEEESESPSIETAQKQQKESKKKRSRKMKRKRN